VEDCVKIGLFLQQSRIQSDCCRNWKKEK